MHYLLTVKITLIIAGIIGVAVGIGQLFFPVVFEASTGIVLDNNISLLSEFHGAGGTLLTAGTIILAGAFMSNLRGLALVLAALFFLSYGLSRIYGMLVDGMPNEGLVIVTAIEVGVGIMALILHRNFRRQQQ